MGSCRAGGDRSAIRFGTSGWRGILGEDVSFGALRRLVRATARWLSEGSGSDRVLVGFDGRFASRRMAEITRVVLAQEGLRPVVSRGVVPTPVLTHALLRRRAGAALMLTASHNPPEYHGLKVFGPSGGCIVDEEARRIEAIAAGLLQGGPGDDPASPERVPRAAKARPVDFVSSYCRSLRSLLDVELLARSGLRIAYDAMHGAGSGVLDGVLRSSGLEVEVLHAGLDPLFGGQAPDPIPERLGALRARLRAASRPDLGLATDGDADRFGAVLPGGRVLSETEVLGLLVDHLARTGRVRRGLAISRGAGTLLQKIADHHGLPLERLPVGFKHLSDALWRGRADVAGEESGGFGMARMGRDKDGILAGCLLCEIAAASPGGLAARMRELEERFGRSACGRRAIASSPRLDAAIDRLLAAPPSRLGDAGVREVSLDDGLRLELDDGFLMLRRSGTEPVIRIYAEARSARAMRQRMDLGESLLLRAASERV